MDAPRRILVIEDSEDVRASLLRQLAYLGFEVRGAADGLEGLAAVEAAPPDLVVCDLRMPRLDGLGVLRVLRERWPGLPVVVMSGEGLLDDAISALKLGAWDYLTKPIPSLTALKLTLDKALEKAALLAENQRQRQRLEVLYRELAADQEAGRRLQLGLLPEDGRRLGSFTLTWELLPSSFLSGDFLDSFAIDAGRWGFYLADVAGHGVPSALVTVMLRTLVDRQVHAHGGELERLGPARFLRELNAALLRQGHDKHVALFYGLVDEPRQELRCANAGCFPFPVLVQGGQARVLELPGMPLGLLGTADYEERAFPLTPDTSLVACTDGVFDAMGEGTADEKARRIAGVAQRARTAHELLQALDVGASLSRPDDVAVLMLRRGDGDALRTP